MGRRKPTQIENYQAAMDALLQVFLPIFPQKKRASIRSKLANFLTTTLAVEENPVCRACEDFKKCLISDEMGNATVYVCSMLDSICDEARQRRNPADAKTLIGDCDYCELYKETYGEQLEPLSEEERVFSVTDLLNPKEKSPNRNETEKEKVVVNQTSTAKVCCKQEVPPKQSVSVNVERKEKTESSSVIDCFVQKHANLVLLVVLSFIALFCFNIAQEVTSTTWNFWDRLWLHMTTLLDYPRVAFLKAIRTAVVFIALWGVALIFVLLCRKSNPIRARRLTAYVAIAFIVLSIVLICNKARTIENRVGSEGVTSSYSQSEQNLNVSASEAGERAPSKQVSQFYEELTRYCPEWEKQNTDKGFLDWLALDNSFWQKKLDKAVSEWKPKEVARIFNKYKKEKKFFDQLTKQIPRWGKLLANKQFLKWLDENDALKKRMEAKNYPQAAITVGDVSCGKSHLDQAFEECNAKKAADIFIEYEREQKFVAQMSEYLPDWREQNTDRNFLIWLSDDYWLKKLGRACDAFDAYGVSEIFRFYRKQKKLEAYLTKVLPNWENIMADKNFSSWLDNDDFFWRKQFLKACVDGNEKKVEYIIRKYCEETGSF